MKTVAIILAGGVGSRFGANIPKQFLMLNDKPVIVHTLERFEKNERTDEILIVCIEDWITEMQRIVDKYGIKKAKWIIPGGNCGHDSTRNALFFLQDKITKDDIVIIHDAARPILPQLAINKMLDVTIQDGNASLAIPCHETIILTDDGLSGTSELDRSKVMRVQTPQAYRFAMILDSYEKAEAENKHDFIYADLVAIHYGHRIYFSKGFTNNIKITRKEDLPLCSALLNFDENALFNL